ncbi:MAG: Y-family DNA polymerase [Candidatus Cryptobacteroides sp.]
MIALADCNTFFASVERVFHPGLGHSPVCVLSSNDGIIVALTAEAKALGLRRGMPVHQVRDIISRNGVTVFSSNMMLYSAMSKRVQSIIRQTVEKTECYSIDEHFLYLDGYERYRDPEKFMREMVQKIRLWTDIPVSVGIAATKTLAKVANKFAKKYPGYRSVCMIDNDDKRRKALSMSDLSDVWGLGSSSFRKLTSSGILTPLQFADADGEWVRRLLHKPGYRTWLELNGYPCIDTAEILSKQNITTSRSFGEMISDIEQLKASVASFAASCAGKLRAQGSSAGSVTVYVCSNRFREDMEQYAIMDTELLPVPSADTIEITDVAMKIADRIFKPGIRYKKSGVILGKIVPEGCGNVLFDPVPNRDERLGLSRTLDSLN